MRFQQLVREIESTLLEQHGGIPPMMGNPSPSPTGNGGKGGGERGGRIDSPQIGIGDTVRVGVLIQEGSKQRVQPYQGMVVARHRAGVHTTLTVRRVFQGVGVERVFPLHSPLLRSISVLKRARVRRAKLYYLRERVGKAARLASQLNDSASSACPTSAQTPQLRGVEGGAS